jgi:hypothetical protein
VPWVISPLIFHRGVHDLDAPLYQVQSSHTDGRGLTPAHAGVGEHADEQLVAGQAMVPVALALLGARLDRDSVLFVGWFGPRGLASLVFALLALEELGPGAD